MPATLKVRWNGRDWAHQVCLEGQVTQVFPPQFEGDGPGTCVEVDMTGVPVPPAKQEVASLDGEPLDEFEVNLIRRLRRGMEPPDGDWPNG